LGEGPDLGEEVPGHPHDDGGDGGDVDGALTVDPAGAWSDRDEAADHAVHPTEEGGLLLLGEPGVHGDPHDHTGGGGNVGVDDGRCAIRTCVVGFPTVEAVPAEPQDAGPDPGHHQVVRYGVLSVS